MWIGKGTKVNFTQNESVDVSTRFTSSQPTVHFEYVAWNGGEMDKDDSVRKYVEIEKM